MKSGNDEREWTDREDRAGARRDELGPRAGPTLESVLVSDAGGVGVLWELDTHLAQEQEEPGAGGAARAMEGSLRGSDSDRWELQPDCRSPPPGPRAGIALVARPNQKQKGRETQGS